MASFSLELLNTLGVLPAVGVIATGAAYQLAILIFNK